MTICAVNVNLLQATLYKSQLEFGIMNISNKRQQIAGLLSGQLANADWENDPRVRQLQFMDEKLELQQKQLETQQKTAAAQVESFQKLLDSNTNKDFKLNINA